MANVLKSQKLGDLIFNDDVSKTSDIQEYVDSIDSI